MIGFLGEAARQGSDGHLADRATPSVMNSQIEYLSLGIQVYK